MARWSLTLVLLGPCCPGQAAVAFFELLGLNAKGFVKLEQKSAYGDITIAPRDLLIKYAAKI